jgi:hypothetical protein
MKIHYWATTAKEATIQQQLLSNDFANEHVSTATIVQQ